MWAWSCWPSWKDFLLVRDCNRVPHCREVRGWLMVVSVNWVGEGVVVYEGDSRLGSLLRWFMVGCLRKLGERMAFMKGRVKEWVVEKLDCSRGLRAWQFRKWWEVQRYSCQAHTNKFKSN